MPGEFSTFGGASDSAAVPLDELAGQITSANEMVTAIISDGLAKLATYISQASQQLSKTTKVVRAGVKRKITKVAAPVVSAVGSLSMQAQNRISEGQIAVDRAAAAARTISTENRTGNATYIPPGATGDSGIYTPPPGGSSPVVGMPGVFTDAQGLTYTQTSGGASYWGAGTTYTAPTQPATTDTAPVQQSAAKQLTPDQSAAIGAAADALAAKCKGITQIVTFDAPPQFPPGMVWTKLGDLPFGAGFMYCGVQTAQEQPTQPGQPVIVTDPQQLLGGASTVNTGTGEIIQGCGTPPYFLMAPGSTGPYYAQPSSPTLPDGFVTSLLPDQVSGATEVWDSTGLLCGYIPGNSTLSGPTGGNGQATQTAPAAPCELPPDIASWPGQRIVQLPYDLGQSGEASPFGECGTLMISDAIAQMLSVSDVIKAATSPNPVAAFEASSKPLSMEDALYLGIEE